MSVIDEFTSRGILSPADVQTAAALVRLSHVRNGPVGDDDALVELAAAFAVRAVRHGSVAVDLGALPTSVLTDGEDAIPDTDLPWPDESDWRRAVETHAMVASPGAGDDRPLRWDDGLLYLQKYWQLENTISAQTIARTRDGIPVSDAAALRAAVNRIFPSSEPDRQRLAAVQSALQRLTILAGGPGTGKTTAIAGILSLLRETEGPDLLVALAAPTGKAAARLSEATAEAMVARYAADDPRRATPDATTIHRLLGWRPDARARFAHSRFNPLPHDVVIVDEASMVSLSLMARLMESVRPDARLVLVGDPDQLASIDAGAVLADLVAVPSPADPALARVVADVSPPDAGLPVTATGAVTLSTVYRFAGGIAELASAIRDGDDRAALDAMRRGDADVEFIECEPNQLPESVPGIDEVRADVVATARAVLVGAASCDAATALAALGEHRVLCAHRLGPYGVARWNELSRVWIGKGRSDGDGNWPVGQPLIVTENDYSLGLFNGDTGVIVATADGGVVAAFPRADEPLLVPPVRLEAVTSLDAMTIHRGQGSQFERVTIVLPPPESPLLTRELLYTAVTRAQRRVRLVGTSESIRAAVGRRVTRASGLRRRIAMGLAEGSADR